MRQQQQPNDEPRVDLPLSVDAETILPVGRPSRTIGAHKDIDGPQVAQRQLTRDFAALSRLLHAPQPAEQLVSTALVVAARLLPRDWMLRLFESPDSGTTLREVTPSSGHQLGENKDLRMTLGFGEAVDYKVLREGVPVQVEQTICIPLIDAKETLVGVLVALQGSKTTGPHLGMDDAMFAVISAHLTTLLARAGDERLNRSSALAMQALPILALPSVVQSSVRGSGAVPDAEALDAFYVACDRLLTSAVVVLNEVIAAVGWAESALALALTRMRSGEWRLLRVGVPPEQPAPIFSHEMLSSIAHLAPQSQRDILEPLEVTATSNLDIWESLTSLRAHVAAYEGMEVAHLTLLPIFDNEQGIVACLCVARRSPANVSMERLLPLITCITVATTAGVNNLQLAEVAQAEGRARDAFISLTAHELRNPITSIKGYAQLLMRQSKKYPIPEPMLRSVESIEQQSERMAEMVGELLDASRVRRGVLDVQVSPVDLVPLVRKVVERRAAQFPQHTFTCDVVEERVVALADAQRVEQVLRALIDNSARHMLNGGTVAVVLSRWNGMALFTVRDQGIGIPEGEREQIFEYLYRSSLSERKHLSGLGLGLYVSRHLVERLGGRLWLEYSNIAEPTGSEFRFTLPLAETSMDDTPHERS